MYTYTKSIFIDRPQQEVFDFVTNPANHPQWSSATESAKWISKGPPGVGSTYGVLVKLGWSSVETKVEVTAWEPFEMYSTKGTEGNIQATSQSRFEPKDAGTQLTVNGTLQGGGVGKLMEGLFGRLAERQDGKDLDALKYLLESD
jgi:uncharacterized membrane protein